MKTKKELWAKIFIRHFEVVCDWVSLGQSVESQNGTVLGDKFNVHTSVSP